MPFTRLLRQRRNGENMKALIFVGGGIAAENINLTKDEDDIVIAADSGYLNAKELGFLPDLLVGDFDSLGKEKIPSGIEVSKLPTEKDFTDTQAACEIAMENGAREIIIVGGLDGRLDHTLSNMGILRELYEKRIRSYITDGRNRVRYIRNTNEIIVHSSFKYLSIIADDEIIKGVDVEGCKYPLKNAKLTRNHQFAVSNEIVGNCALVSVKKGGLFIIESGYGE